MGEVIVHPRVTERHPQLTDIDVYSAWSNVVRATYRIDGDSVQVLAIGFDGRGRIVEMVAKEQDADYLIYHAMTPPTEKALNELGYRRRLR